MKLTFCNPRTPTSVDELAPHQIEQLELAGDLYHGEEVKAARLLADDDDDEDEVSLAGLALWDIQEGGRTLYEAWFYRADSGTIFNAGTSDVAAEVIQCGLECEDEALEAALLAAAKVARSSKGRAMMTIRS
jgi:hypothetical protein